MKSTYCSKWPGTELRHFLRPLECKGAEGESPGSGDQPIALNKCLVNSASQIPIHKFALALGREYGSSQTPHPTASRVLPSSPIQPHPAPSSPTAPQPQTQAPNPLVSTHCANHFALPLSSMAETPAARAQRAAEAEHGTEEPRKLRKPRASSLRKARGDCVGYAFQN